MEIILMMYLKGILSDEEVEQLQGATPLNYPEWLEEKLQKVGLTTDEFWTQVIAESLGD